MERPLVCTIYKVLRRRDLDDKSFRRACDDRGQHVRPDQKRRTDLAHRRNRRRRRHPDRIWEIGELVCGRVPRLQDDREITILKNNGLSVQFAGVGAAVMRRARERGLGRELPSYLFETAFAHSPPPLTKGGRSDSRVIRQLSEGRVSDCKT